MCMRVTCEKCKKATYAGCGRHIEQVLGNVPRDERCECRAKASDTNVTSPSLMRRIFGL